MPAGVTIDPLRLTVRKGSAVFLHADLAHASLNNNTEKFRYALLCTYIRRGGTFRPGSTAQRSEIDLHVAA